MSGESPFPTLVLKRGDIVIREQEGWLPRRDRRAMRRRLRTPHQRAMRRTFQGIH